MTQFLFRLRKKSSILHTFKKISQKFAEKGWGMIENGWFNATGTAFVNAKFP